MLSKIREFVKRYSFAIMLIIGAVLVFSLGLATGFIAARLQEKSPIRFEYQYK